MPFIGLYKTGIIQTKHIHVLNNIYMLKRQMNDVCVLCQNSLINIARDIVDVYLK